MNENLPLFSDLPVYQEDLDRLADKRKKDFQNDLKVQLNRLMNYFKVEAADIHRATNVPWSTISGWVNGNVETQMLDDNIKKVARFFSVSVDFLAYATPMSERDAEVEAGIEAMEEIENNKASA